MCSIDGSLRFPCQARYAPRARAAFEMMLPPAVDADTKWRLLQVVGEAVGMTIKYSRTKATYFNIRVRLRRAMLRVDIENDGGAFDPVNQPPEDMRGYGMTIIAALSESIAFFNDGRMLRIETRLECETCSSQAAS